MSFMLYNHRWSTPKGSTINQWPLSKLYPSILLYFWQKVFKKWWTMLKRNPQKLDFFMLCFIVLKKTQCENSSLKKNLLTTWAIELHTWETKAFVTPCVGLIWPSMINLFIMLDETPCKISCIALKVLVWVGYSYIKMCYDNKSYIKKSQDDKLILNIRFEWNLIHTN